jgi:acyl transferase domain-containing protein
VLEVAGPWQVTFAPQTSGKGGQPPTAEKFSATFEALADWTTRPEPEIRHHAGEATYRTTLVVPESVLRVAGPLALDLGDVKEIGAIRSTFAGKSIPAISSTKSLTGHSLGATGVQEAIYSLLMMQHDFIAASAHIDNLDPAVADMPIVRPRIDNQRLDAVMSNSFGFGGTNATLVFERYEG